MHTDGAVTGPAPEFLVECRICGQRMRFINGSHLKKHFMTAEEYKRRYGIAYLMSKAQRERSAVLHCGDRSYVARNVDEIIAALQAYAKECMPLSYTYLRLHDKILLGQAERAFGSWRNALKAAGIRGCMEQRWSAEVILEMLEKRRRAEKPLNACAIASDDPRLYSATIRYFGTLETALGRLGVDYDRVKRVRSRDDETYRRDLLEWCAKNGPLTPKVLLETDVNLYQTALNKHGDLRTVGRKFGLPYRGIRKKWTKETVVEALRAYHRAEGPLSETKLHKQDGSLYSAVRRHFGTLRAAADELYLPFRRVQRVWDQETVVRALMDRAAANLPLQAKKVQEAGGGLVKAAIRHFGSWAKAKNAAGLAGDVREEQGEGVVGHR